MTPFLRVDAAMVNSPSGDETLPVTRSPDWAKSRVKGISPSARLSLHCQTPVSAPSLVEGRWACASLNAKGNKRAAPAMVNDGDEALLYSSHLMLRQLEL